MNSDGADPSRACPGLPVIPKARLRSRATPITHGVTDISYPVFGFYGNLVAALAVPFLELIDGSQKVGISETRKYLAAAAQAISTALGYRGGLKGL